MGKTFRSATSKTLLDFTLAGGDEDDPDEYPPYSETFYCRSQIPAGLILRFGELTTSTEGEEIDAEDLAKNLNGAIFLGFVHEFFNSALIKKDRDRFFDLLNDPDRPVDFPVLIETMNDLVSQYTADRPTGGSSSTSSSGTTNGPGSTAGVSPAALTFSRPERPLVAHST